MHTIGKVNNTAESVTKAGRLNHVAEKGANVLERGRQPGSFHGGVSGSARFSTGIKTRHFRERTTTLERVSKR